MVLSIFCSGILTITGRYANQGQLSPVSNSGSSRDNSPRTPNSRLGLNKSTDDYAPKIASHEDGPRSMRDYGRRPGGYGNFERSDSTGSNISEPRDPLPKQQHGGFLERIQNIPPNSLDVSRKPSAARNALPQRKDSLSRWDPPPDLNISANGPSRQPQRKNGYGGFGSAGDAIDMNPPPPMNRADTFPKPAPLPELNMSRRPSAPGLRSSPVRRPSTGPDTSLKPPPRTNLFSRPDPSADLAAEFGDCNPYHTPRDSMTSAYLSASPESVSSPHSRPGTSFRRNEPDLYNRNNPVDSHVPQRENGRPTDLRIDPAVQAPLRSAMVESPYGVSPREDRYDPAIQNGRPTPSPIYGSRPRDDGSGYSNDRYPNPPRRVANMREPSREPIIPQSRGDCKACKMPITGKSISSADGRLTGKYHKACFVCTTCKAPFMSAEFYVHADKPYCELHYHELNGSLCGSCGRGIEGQYAEDEGKTKYHVGCFCCLDCGISLTDGYFEVDGYAYCERDAWRRVEQQSAPAVTSLSDANSYPPPLPNGHAVPRMPNGRGPRAAAGMQRGPYGMAPSAPGKPARMQKRMTRIGMM